MHPRPFLVASMLSFALAGLIPSGCGDTGGKKDGAAADAKSGGDGEAAGKTDDKAGEENGGGEAGAPEMAPGEACKALVTRTKEVCDAHLHGAPDAGCLLAIKGIEAAAKQADGKLFDVGKDNQAAADASCKAHLSGLEKAAKEAEGAEKATWGPECTKVVELLQTTCLDKLGTPEGPKGCLEFSGARAILTKDPNKDNELGCGMWMKMKGK